MNTTRKGLARRWVVMPFLAAALLLALVGRAQAVDIAGDGVVAAGEVIDDDVLLFGTQTRQARMDGTVNGTLLASGGDVVINGTVNGDVIVWSKTATVNGVINGNLFAGGGAITVNAPVKGTIFLTGYSFTLGPALSVERNLFFSGYSLQVEPGAQIGIDMLSAGYQVSMGGSVGRDLLADVVALKLEGQVGRNAKPNVAAPTEQAVGMPPFVLRTMGLSSVETLPSGLQVTEKASIGGKLTYTSPVNQDNAIKAAPAGGTEYIFKVDTAEPQPARQVDFVTSAVTSLVNAGRDFLTLMALGSLALYFLPGLAARALAPARQKALPSAGWGAVVFVLGYAGLVVAGMMLLIVGILLGVVTFGGLANLVFGVGFAALGLATAAFSALVAYGSKLVVAVAVGQLLVRSLAPRLAENRYWALAAGVLIYVVLRDLPGILPVAGPAFGWLVGVAATLVGLGAMWLAFREWRAGSRGAAPGAPADVPPAQPAA